MAPPLRCCCCRLRCRTGPTSASSAATFLPKRRLMMHDAPLTCCCMSPQTWTNRCIFGHDIEGLRAAGYGENVAMGFSTWDDAVRRAWLAEQSIYDFSRPGYSDATGHFT